jgi:hypothetical protein
VIFKTILVFFLSTIVGVAAANIVDAIRIADQQHVQMQKDLCLIQATTYYLSLDGKQALIDQCERLYPVGG